MVRHRLNLRRSDPQRRLADGRRHSLDSGSGRDDDRRQRHQRENDAARQCRRTRHTEKAHENGEAEETEDDRRNRGEVIDVQPNKNVPDLLD